MTEATEIDCLAAAIHYLRHGFSVLGLCPADHRGVSKAHVEKCNNPGKVPVIAWKALQERRPSEQELCQLWGANPHVNVGVALGPVSGIVRVDIDGPVGEAVFRDLCRGQPPPTWEFSSGGNGRGLLYAIPPGVTVKTTTTKGEGIHQELRIQAKGAQSVLPPSLHVSGRRYAWLAEHGPDEIEIALMPDWMVKMMQLPSSSADSNTPSKGTVPSYGNAPPNGGTHPDRTGSFVLRAHSGPGTVDRALIYLNTIPPAISGQRGHNQTLWAARVLVIGFDLGPDVALALLLQHYNPRCQPPWTEKELEHKCREAHTKPFDKPRGWLLSEAAPEARKSPFMPGDAFEGYVATEPGDAAEGSLVLNSLSGVTPKPIRWLVPDYLPLGKVTLKAGDGGPGKSLIELDTAACLTTGRPCYGLQYEAPPPSEVMLITCEDGLEDTIVPRLIAAGADMSKVHHVAGIRGKHGILPFNLDYFLQIDQALRQNRRIKLVIIDPAGGFISGRINDHKDAELRQLLQPLATIADELEVSIVLVKHLNKNAGVKAVHRVSGSTAWVNTVRLAYFVCLDDEDPDLRLMIPIKGNIAKRQRGLKYRIEQLDPVVWQADFAARYPQMPDADSKELATQMHRIRWEGTTEKSADDLNAASRKQKSSSLEEVKAWLREQCQAFAYPCTELDALGAEQGIKERALREARMALKEEGYYNQKVGFGPDSTWWFGKGKRDQWTQRPAPDAKDAKDRIGEF